MQSNLELNCQMPETYLNKTVWKLTLNICQNLKEGLRTWLRSTNLLSRTMMTSWIL